MGSIIGVLVLFLTTLTLGGCAGLLNGLGYGSGDGMNGYGGVYDTAATAPAAQDPAYAAAATAGSYLPQTQTQPYYTSQPYGYSYNGAATYTPDPPSGVARTPLSSSGVAGSQLSSSGVTGAPLSSSGVAGSPLSSSGVAGSPLSRPGVAGAPLSRPGVAGAPLSRPGDPSASPWIGQREREQADRIRQGLLDGSLTPQEARRLWAEQRRIRATEAQMRAYGYLNPQERARLTAMQNRGSRAIYRARHNGMVRPGTLMPPPGHGPLGLMGQPGTNGASTPAQVRPQAPGYGQGSQLLPNQRFRRISTAPDE
jgi:hypothetical protein